MAGKIARVAPVPETAHRQDWPRLVAAHAASIAEKVAALETYTATSFTFTPTTAPTSPVEGQTYMDSALHKLRTWDGTAWQNHW